MGLYIEGMEMPTEEEIGKCIIVRHDGEVWIVEFDNLVDGGYVACYPTNPTRAVPVPPHGDLIDRSQLCDDSIGGDYGSGTRVYYAYEVEQAPVIIPASEEGE